MSPLTVVVMVAGVFALALAWRLVASRRVSIWPAMSVASGGAGLAALATGRVPLSQNVGWPAASITGLGAGVALYLVTAAFVLVVRRWPVFDRHVAEIYDQRKGLALGPALVLAAAVVAPGEELFWRGLFQSRLAPSAGWAGAAALTWAVYALTNAASGNLPIVAGGLVGGAVWGGLAMWTHGVVASIACHSAWTALMLSFPPGGNRARPRVAHRSAGP
jgi:membrane protease YdiL (CAAX protease family)